MFQKRLDFFASQRMVLLMFFEALYFGHFLSFYTMQLEPPKYRGVCKFGIGNLPDLPTFFYHKI